MFKAIKEWTVGSYYFGKSMTDRYIFGNASYNTRKFGGTMFDVGAGVGLGYLTLGNAVALGIGAMTLATPIVAAAGTAAIAGAVGIAAIKLCVGVVLGFFTVGMAGISVGFLKSAADRTGLSNIGFGSNSPKHIHTRRHRALKTSSNLKNAPKISKSFGNSGAKPKVANSNQAKPPQGDFKFK